MNIYSICHHDTYLDRQVKTFQKFAKNCNFNIVVPNIHSKFLVKYFQKYDYNIIIPNNNWYIDIVNEIAKQIENHNEFSIIVEWDVVPIKNILPENFASYRGPQSIKNKEIKIKSYYPNIIGFNPATTIYNDNFFQKNEKPFLNDFIELEHGILTTSNNIVSDCAIENNFSKIGNDWIHCLHGCNITEKRLTCWNNIIDDILALS